MTALERQMAADAIALSKEHADRADAATARAATAEAKLAAIAGICQRPFLGTAAEERLVADILAVIGTKEDAAS
jgi:hypothetical protein